MRRLALFAALVAITALLLESAAAQTADVSTTLQRLIVVNRDAIERPVQDARSLPLEATITGPVTLEVAFDQDMLSPTLSLFNATNATLSDLQNTVASRNWTFVLTPTADGAVTVTLPASSVQLDSPHVNRWNIAATLSLTADLGAPTIVWRGFSSFKNKWNGHGPYASGDPVDMTITFSERVTVTGAPYVRLRIGARQIQLVYQSGSGTDTLVFRYTIPSGFPSTGWNPAVLSSSVEIPDGASIADGGGTAAVTTLPPQMTGIQLTLVLLLVGETDDGAVVGDQHEWVLTYDRAVTVTQAAGVANAYVRVRVKKQDGTFTDVRAVYTSGSGSRSLTFRYTVLAADMIASDSSFGLQGNHVHTPDGFGIRDASGVDAVTQFGAYSVVGMGRERTQVQIPVVLSAAYEGEQTYHFTSSVPALMTLNPTSVLFLDYRDDQNDWARVRTLIATLRGDADTDDNSVSVLVRIASTTLSWRDGLSGTWRRLTVLDDDPEIDTLTAASASILEGQEAEFQVGLTEPPPAEGRKVLATVTESGDCLASSVTDADADVAGLQQEVELRTSSGAGVGTLSLPTVDDEVGEAGCVVSVALTPPSDPANVFSFALAGSATSLQQSVTVQDDDGGQPPVIPPGPGSPTASDLYYPEPPHPPVLEDLTIIEGASAEGEFNITRSDMPLAAIEFFQRFQPEGVVEASPDPVRFSRSRWWERKAWAVATAQDADSEDERVWWYLDASSEDGQWQSIYVHPATIIVRDDDPQVSALEALDDSIMEGDTAAFRLRFSKPPLDGARTVRVSLNWGGDVLAAGLVDVDAEKPGVQLDLSLQDTVDGAPTALLRIATEDDEQDEPGGIIVVVVTQPSDHTAANYFTLAGDKESLVAAVSVLDNDEPPPRVAPSFPP